MGVVEDLPSLALEEVVGLHPALVEVVARSYRA
jgi:hypothetical protein